MPTSQTLSGVRNLPKFADGVAGIATNSEITNILFRSLLNAFAPQGMAKKYWRFNVGDGLPDWVEQDGLWQWKLLATRQEEERGELDNTKAIPMTEQKAREYISLPGAQTMVIQCAGSLE